jgi:uncharacterized protein (TIGR02147 family)
MGMTTGTTTANTNLPDFSDYRTFLADRLRRLKSADPKFSHRFVNQRMGARSAGWLADMLAGRQRLKPRQVAPIAAVLRLDAREKDLLRALVDLEAADAPDTREAAYGKWLELKGIPAEDVDRDRFHYFERWYYPALRELLLLAPFDGDYAALGARLDPPITARQASEAVGTLKRLGLLNPGAPAPVLVKRPGKTPHWSKILKAYTELSLPAMQKYGKEERDFSSLILSLSPEGLKAAGEEIAALRRRLLAISGRDTGSRRVYQALFQVFPLSQSIEDVNA